MRKNLIIRNFLGLNCNLRKKKNFRECVGGELSIRKECIKHIEGRNLLHAEYIKAIHTQSLCLVSYAFLQEASYAGNINAFLKRQTIKKNLKKMKKICFFSSSFTEDAYVPMKSQF